MFRGVVAVLVACGGQDSDPFTPPSRAPASIVVFAGDNQRAPTATWVPVDPLVEVRDQGGTAIPNAVVSFRVMDGGGWVVHESRATDGQGRASTPWYLGPVAGTPQTIEARIGSLSVSLSAEADRPTAGQSIPGANGYIEWIPGELPIIVSAPHGGTTTPSGIPDRTVGTTTRDLNTGELAREVSDALVARFGQRPHLIICQLHRRKLDANREIVEAAAGNPDAERSWREYHGFIEASGAEIRLGPGMGFYIDLHGHGHDIQRLELGYLLDAAALAMSDAQLTGGAPATGSSLWPLAISSDIAFPALLRGPGSLGALLEGAGFPSVPGPTTPGPGSAPFFEGGYSTQRHGLPAAGRFAGLQIEANLVGVRDTPQSRAAFAAALAGALDSFLRGRGVALPPALSAITPRQRTGAVAAR